MIIKALQSIGSRLASLRGNRFPQTLASYRQGRPISYADTRMAIEELNQLAKHHPQAVEVFLALGNLHRAQGDLERAIRIRKTLLARPDLEPHYKGKALYELGLDYRRSGFLDRAGESLAQARQLLGDDPVLLEEMAKLAASEGSFALAAEYYEVLGYTLAQAHYLVRQAQSDTADSGVVTDKRLLRKAIKIYPPAVEAWLEILIRDCSLAAWSDLASDYRQALNKVDPSLHFVLLEGLIRYLVNLKEENEIFTPDLAPEPARVLLQVLSKREPDAILSYYAAWLALQREDREQAIQWLDRSLEMDPNFWPSRVELISLSAHKEDHSLEFKAHLDYLIRGCRRQRRFICRACGLTREQIFFLCSRCHSWHSIAFVKS